MSAITEVTPPPRGRKARGDGGERHDEILDAAQRIFLEEGFENATMRRIAAAVGIAPTTVYIYFADKAALHAALRDRTFQDLHAFTRNYIGDESDPRRRLLKHVEAYVEFGVSRPEEYRLTFMSHAVRPPRQGRPGHTRAARGQQDFAMLVGEVATLLGLDPLAPSERAHVMAEAIWAAAHGMVCLMIDVSGFPVSGRRALTEEMLAMLVAGIEQAGARAR